MSLTRQSGFLQPFAFFNLVVLAFLLWLTSLYHVLKFANGWLAAAYLLLLCVTCPVLVHLAARWCKRRSIWTAAIVTTFVIVLAMLISVYPRVNTQVPGKGSDRDDALNTGAVTLIDGRWPYSRPTYLGTPISPMPGAIILATPFVLLGTSAYQIPVWLALFAITGYRVTGGLSWASAALLLLVPCWLAMLHEIATGGDYVINALYVLCPSVWLLCLRRPMIWKLLLLSLLLGLAYSSRLNYLVTVPALITACYAIHGSLRTLIVAATAGAVFLGVSLPFYLYDPANFGPMLMQDKFGEIGRWAEGKGWVFAIGAGLINASGAVCIVKRPSHALLIYLSAFAAATLAPGLVGSVAQLLNTEAPLFARWTSGALPALILVCVLLASRSPSQLGKPGGLVPDPLPQ